MFIDKLSKALAQHEPRRLPAAAPRRPASVAMVTAASDDGPQILLIERARRGSDPWSGHLAFPGGRVDATDHDRRATAERETAEEVGLALRPREFLGQFDDIGGASQPVIVSAYAYALDEPRELRLEANEVADAFWVPVTRLLERERWTRHAFTYEGVDRTLPAVDLLGEGRPVLWGLTYRLIVDALHMVGHDEVPHAW